MFESARIKLTAWYVVIIMFVSLVFSVAFYQVSTRELSRLIERIEAAEQGVALMRLRPGAMVGMALSPNLPPLEELQDIQRRLQLRLLLINLGILAGSSVAGYFLAGKTLQPIQTMVEKQQQFIANASHELRTPLATLQVEMEAMLLEKHITVRDVRKLIRSNLEEVRSLEELANGLLRIAQLQEETEATAFTPVSVRDVVVAAEKKVGPLAVQKRIVLKRELNDSIVMGNEADLTAVFAILLENAIKYSLPKGSIHIRSQQTARDVQISIRDSGPGIRPEDLSHIFERFYRADTSRSETTGFGLGLSIAQEIVVRHGGSIRVESELGTGSTFTVQFPRMVKS